MAETKPPVKVKCILIIIDGVGDVGMNCLNRQTPLQEREYPFYNAISSTGLSGIMDPVETGLGCGSDTAHMSILGYNPFKHYRGRGCFETLGVGIPMDQEEIGFKCNFAHMEEQSRIVTLRRVDRDFDQWGLKLVDVIHGIKIPGFEQYEVSCYHATEHRCGLKVRGSNLSEAINGTDPLKDNFMLKDPTPKMRDKNNQNAILTAKITKALSEAIFNNLTEHPINKERKAQGKPTANILLLRGCGKRLDVKPFKELQQLNSFMIAPTAIINGLGQCIDMDNIKVEGTTGDYHTNLMIKAENIAINIKKDQYDFGFMHIKAVDDAGHDKSLEIKNKFLIKINESLIHLFNCLNKQENNQKIEYVYCLTGDHSTPISYGDHSSEPVPVSMTTQTALNRKFGKLNENQLNSGVVKDLCNISDEVQLFNEIDCGAGVLGRFNGGQIMKLFHSFKQQVEAIYAKY